MRVFITGLGAITPIGNTVEESWKNLLDGVHGIDQVTAFDPVNYRTKLAAEVSTDLTAFTKSIAPNLKISNIEDSAKFSVVATHMALKMRNLMKIHFHSLTLV